MGQKLKRPRSERQYEREADRLARSNIAIYPCADCGHPVIGGYVCQTCGSDNPSAPSANALPEA